MGKLIFALGLIFSTPAFAGDFEVTFQSITSKGITDKKILIAEDDSAEGEFTSEGNLFNPPTTIKYYLNNTPANSLYLTLKSKSSVLEFEVFGTGQVIEFDGIPVIVRRLR